MNLEQNEFKTITIGTRVTAIQKKIYLIICVCQNGLSLFYKCIPMAMNPTANQLLK
jgi:hypothetical protein